ncbi:MAG: response regulator [Planctomycetes bacterium]|nr:response regulator [Planctomycetota bacterium]MCH9725243.1 response regulator [Planctomycetota bacterium]MCH9779537.1 response regulator [Planctomycetota bacterium]MCH9792013.1 response regulator [Planctomycetota bacterium]
MKILIVDEVGYSCHFHARLIEKFGYIACTATSGFEALNYLKTDNDINIVITDLMMRGMDGVDLYQEAQKLLYQEAQKLERYTDEGQLDPPQFILMTALRLEKNLQDKDVHRLKLAKEIGISKVMFKPLDQKELEEAIKELVAKGPVTASNGKQLDLYKATQELKETVKEIIESGNSDAAEKVIGCLNSEVSTLEKFIETVGIV